MMLPHVLVAISALVAGGTIAFNVYALLRPDRAIALARGMAPPAEQAVTPAPIPLQAPIASPTTVAVAAPRELPMSERARLRLFFEPSPTTPSTGNLTSPWSVADAKTLPHIHELPDDETTVLNPHCRRLSDASSRPSLPT